MNIIDTYNNLMAAIDNMNGVFDLSIWEAYAKNISQHLPDKLRNDSISYDFSKDVAPVIHNAINSRESLQELHDSFLDTTANLNERFIEIFGIDLPVDIILYLGLCNGAGWATMVDNRKTVLLGIEKIIELNWFDKKTMAALIYHELGHIWHDMVGTLHRESKTNGEESAWQLYAEGVAMYCEQLLTGDFSGYHQDKNGWLAWCEANKKMLFQEFVRRVKSNENTQDFFGDWRSYKDYSDVGYFLGCEFIKSLTKNHSINEIANFDINKVYDILINHAV